MPLDPETQRRRGAARDLVEALQARHVARLERAAEAAGAPTRFRPVRWSRDGGRHGGGTRFQAAGGAFNRASVNVSVVHYDDRPDKALSSATALSAIVHPHHPRAPSLHLHASWTALKAGRAYWRIMADLNPALPQDTQTATFRTMLADRAGPWFEAGARQGDRYFAIPALDRHRGVVHFYLEGHDTGDFDADLALARRVEEGVIDTYGQLLEESVGAHPEVSDADRQAQLAYHTVYLFQVLTLDRGTTSGLLVHGDNDVGILGSLPSHVDRRLLASWADRVPAIQRPLVEGLAAALPDAHPAPVEDGAKRRLAKVVRDHYRAHPQALALQARGDVVPPTVANHKGAGPSGG